MNIKDNKRHQGTLQRIISAFASVWHHTGIQQIGIERAATVSLVQKIEI